MKINQTQITSFIDGYLTAALWSSSYTLEDGSTVELDNYEWEDGEAEKLQAECISFIHYAENALFEYSEKYKPNGYDVWECAGHDFWLTRNGHGAGFWDRGLGVLGKRLTDASKAFGTVDLYLGDDEKVYVS